MESLSMFESQSVSKVRQELSTTDRLYIIQTVKGLPPTQFDELCFTLNLPKGVVPPNSAPPGNRCKTLLDWVESSTGLGLVAVDEVLQTLVPRLNQPSQSAQVTTNLPRLFKRLKSFLTGKSKAPSTPHPIGKCYHPKTVAISGSMGELSPAELEAIAQLLRQKTDDGSIDIAFSTEGRIKLVLNGSPEGLEKLQALFDAGELTAVLDGRSVESVHSIKSDTTEARKARLLQVLRFNTKRINLIQVLARDLDIARAQDITQDLDTDLVRDITRAQTLDRGIGVERALALALHIARDLDTALARTLKRAQDRDRDIARAQTQTLALALALVRDIALERDIEQALALARDITQARNIARARARNIAQDIAQDIAREQDIALALERALEQERTLEQDLNRALDRALNLNIELKGADLRDTNLRDLDLRGIDLEGADLTNADVTGTLFGENPGLTETDKQDLQQRGATFQEPPSSDVSSRVLR